MTRLRAVAMVAGILAFLCLGGALASFAALNTHWVIVRAGVVTFDGLEPSMVVREWDAQLYGLLLGALIAGWCAATLAYLPLWLRRTMRANRDRRYIDELEQELVELRNMPVTNPTPLEDLPDETPATASRQASKSEEELTAELLAGLSDDEEQSAAAPRRLQDQGGAVNLLVLVGVGFVLLVVGTLLGRYYVPDRRPLQRAADEGRAYVRGLVELLAGDPTSAVSEIQQALQRNSKNVDAYFALGTLFRQRGEYERAVRVHQTLLVRRDVDKRTKLRVHQQLALDFEAAGFVRRATKALEYVIAHDKKNVAALRELGRLYQSSAEWERAAAVYKRIARVASEDQHEVIAHLLTMSAQQAMDQGSFASARKLLRKALSLDTTSVHTLHALASYHLREGDKRAAVKALRRALEIQPELVAAFLPPLDKALRDLKRPDELRTMLARLIEQHPENVHLQLASARVEARIDPERGLSALERLLQAHPTLLPARREAGKLLLERGDSEQIREAYQQLLQMLALVEQGFRCGACQHTVGDLFWRCKSCGSWGTVRVAWGRRLTERPEP